MKRILLAIPLIISSLIGNAQYGNEWINYNQTYVKFKTAKEGVYRLGYQVLKDAGLPLQTINPQNIQIFHNGKEEFLWISGEADGVFDSTDYIELFCTYNDGKLDEPLFRNPEEQSHQYTSLYQDSTVYFVTWSSSIKGKRYQLNADVKFTGLTPDPYFMYKSVITFNNQWLDGMPYADLGYFSEYTDGEGYLSQNIAGNTVTFNLATPYYDSTGPMPLAHVIGFAASNPAVYDLEGNNHEFECKITNGALTQVLFSKKHRGYNRIEFKDLPVDKKMVKSATQFRFTSILGAKGRHAVSLITFLYPRKFDLGNSTSLNWNMNAGNELIQFKNYTASRSKPIAYNLTNGIKYSPVLNGNVLSFKTGKEAGQVYIADAVEILSISSIEPVAFKQYPNNSTYDYLIISHSSMATGADAYKQYRSSTDGGSHNVLVGFADELYDEFYYGIHHPLALRNWIYYIYDRQTEKPEFLLFLGKGMMYNTLRNNATLRNSGDLVPTMGWPPSDYLFTSKLNASDLRPDIATGRIPANTDQKILDYLSKVKEYETIPIRSKTILQLAGGTDKSENEDFEYKLQSFANIIKGDSFGGNTVMYSKSSSTTIDVSLIDQITGTVNKGVNLINYFGHGAASVTEIDFGKVQNYNNQGKYPVFFFDGCILGNSFETSLSLLEEFLQEPNKGAIAWIAGSFYGYTNELFSLTKTFHQHAFKTSYGKPIGVLMQNTIYDYQNVTNPYTVTHSRVMLLHGDPSLILYSPKEPDYTVNSESIGINNHINASDSFELNFEMINLGKVTYDTVNYTVKLENDGKVLIQDTFKTQPFISSRAIIHKFSKSKLGGGLNKITITVDYLNQIKELDFQGETNNTSIHEIFVKQNQLTILSPDMDEIVATTEVKVQFTSYQKPLKPINYLVQLDTSPSFNGQVLISKNLQSLEVLNAITISLPPLDSTDFYIRVIDVEKRDTVLTTFAYIFKAGKGSSQGYWDKFKASTLEDLSVSDNHKLSFNRTISSNIILTTSGTSIKYGGGGQYGKSIYYGNINYAPGIILLALNPDDESRYRENNKFNVVSGVPWDVNDMYAPYYGKDSLSCLYRYNTNLKEDRDSLTAFLNRIPAGYYLGFMNETTTGIDSWEEELFTGLEKFGATEIRNLVENQPYILWGRKGFSLGQATEVFADFSDKLTKPESQYIVFSTTIYPLKTEGSITSRIFGPSQKWSTAWINTVSDSPDEDFSIEVFGYDINNKASLLIKGNSKEKVIDISSIDAQLYPYLQLKVNLSDVTQRTPLDLSRWTVNYTGLPEGFAYTFHNQLDTIKEGDPYTVSSVFQNISDLPMDSIIVHTRQSFGNGQIISSSDTLKNLSIGDSVMFSHTVSTMSAIGQNSFVILYNPDYAQIEKTISNNGIGQEAYVLSNNRVPILEVYFDNQQILNGQVINPNARVSTVGRSNHPNMKISEPDLYFITFIKNGAQNGDTVLWTNNMVDFVPETDAKPASFDFNFNNLEAGKYTFLARLYSPTESDDKRSSDYTIQFEVSDKNEITELLPYPNPMVNQCRFAYNFGGRTIPTKYHLSIYNISGKLVREVDQQEFGALKFGSQLSEFVFDGRDNFGDNLANGVYLYKFEIQDAELKESAIDKYFNAGFGKIYLAR